MIGGPFGGRRGGDGGPISNGKIAGDRPGHIGRSPVEPDFRKRLLSGAYQVLAAVPSSPSRPTAALRQRPLSCLCAALANKVYGIANWVATSVGVRGASQAGPSPRARPGLTSAATSEVEIR